MNTTLADQLKVQTRDAHRSVESFLPIFRQSFCREHYALLLQNLHSFHFVFESQLAVTQAKLKISFDLDKRSKTPLLGADLTAMKVRPIVRDHTFAFQTQEEFWGALYVVEGSTLGGQIIKRHLQRRLGLADACLNYYSGYGDETAQKWSQFRSVLEGVQPNLDAKKVCAGANAMFENFEMLFKDMRL